MWGKCFKCGMPGHSSSDCRAFKDVNLEVPEGGEAVE